MSSEIFICEKCYDPELMQWEEYTSGTDVWRSCILCGAKNARHWFCNSRYIIKKLIERVRTLQSQVTQPDSEGSSKGATDQ